MRIAFSRLQHLANLLAIGTGVGFAWAKYFAKSADPFSNLGSPWEPATHNAHVLGVPLLLFACGVIWQSHILPMWRALDGDRQGRTKLVSGLGLLFVLVPMAASGYLIQVTTGDDWRKAWVIVHWVTSVVWSLSYLLHLKEAKAQPRVMGLD